MIPLVFHPSVSKDIREVLDYYESISPVLANAFWEEWQACIRAIQTAPTSHHFDVSGRRRVNLSRFPYHILFRLQSSTIRVS